MLVSREDGAASIVRYGDFTRSLLKKWNTLICVVEEMKKILF